MTKFNVFRVRIIRYIILSICLYTTIYNQVAFAQDVSLEQGFKTPPPEAKALVWWHWINGNINKEGITADLEAMKAIGIQGVQIFDVSLGQPNGGVEYLSNEWLDLLKYSALEAQRLGMQLAFHNCSGWSSTGGPCITPEYAMQKVTYADTIVKGDRLFNGTLQQPNTNLNYYKDIAILAFPKPSKDQRIDHLDYKTLSGKVRNHLAPSDKIISKDAILNKEDIVDLTPLCDENGYLEWNVPQGDWVILRLGHTTTGAKNRFPSQGGSGLECDKMNAEAVNVFWESSVMSIIQTLDTLIGTVVNKCHIDSYEVGTANWTTNFPGEFLNHCHYDCRDYLPTLAGYYVESGEETERFLWDFRRTIGDLMAENYYGRFRDLSHEYGMLFSTEPYWGPFDNMQVGETADLVMCEFWSGELAFFDSPKFVASISKLKGQNIAEAEAFTDVGGWQQHPALLKPMGDLAWTQGINRFVFHSYVHQPYGIAPGQTLGPFGIDLNRLNTWWDQGTPFFDYINRGQFLLQQGTSVADVLVFTGQASPNDALLVPEIKSLGYDYDLIGANKMNSLSVEDGLIVTEMGDRYHILVIPEVDWMTPDMLLTLEELAENGATILAAQPKKSPSLNDHPNCDNKVNALANKLWNSGLITNKSVTDVLKSSRLQPDVIIDGTQQQSIDYIHKKTSNSDIYLVVNAEKRDRSETIRFRISDKQPEIWNAETGEISKVIHWRDNGDGTTSIPIDFKPQQSVFFIFRDAPVDEEHLQSVDMHLSDPIFEPLPQLEIVKAEYGVFLPSGLVDVTEAVQEHLKNNQLKVVANRNLCLNDPAPGYHKELRIEYSIGDELFETYAKELEVLEIDASGRDTLIISKAVFGKFEGGVTGIPPSRPIYDVTSTVKAIVASGIYDIQVNDHLLSDPMNQLMDKNLRVVYTTHDEEKALTVPFGRTLKLSRSIPQANLYMKGSKVFWKTPYPGVLNFTSASGKQERKEVKTLPQAIDLSSEWTVDFPTIGEQPFQTLESWSSSATDAVKYFSGTATYFKQFELSDELLTENYALELDVGHVQVIAEVILNGKNLGILWKPPFVVNIDSAAIEGTNTLQIKVTNLWPNRLIGDEYYHLDYKRKGNNIKQLPNWLKTPEQRPSERTTFPGYIHYKKNSDLLPSGLRGPVKVVVYKVTELY